MPYTDLHDKVSAFFKAEQFDQSPGYAKHQEKILVDSGLIEESGETLLEMKRVLQKFQDEKRKIEERKDVFKNRKK